MKKIVLTILMFSNFIFAKEVFEIVALGVSGGVIEGTTSAYLIRDLNEDNYLALDAGSLISGINQAVLKGNFQNIQKSLQENLSDDTIEGYILKNSIKGYFISHAHLDHFVGLGIASTEDSSKNIYALNSVIENLKDNFFNWKLWPNFANEGEGFKLGKYTYKRATPNENMWIENTNLNAKIYPLSHSNYESSMILINSNDNYFAYFGDTGADRVENSNHLNTIWQNLAPLIKDKKLKGVIIETSFINETPDNQLFGHLTANKLYEELAKFENYSGGSGSLKNLNVIITHIKPSLKINKNYKEIIKKEIDEGNRFGIKPIFMEQGESLNF